MGKKGFEVFSDLLHDYEVTHVFYQDAIFRKGMRRAEDLYGIKGIMTHSEGAAGCMADGYARASGRFGVCMAQSIGSANMVGGIQDAWLATTPVLAITGKKPATHLHKNSYQEATHKEMYADVTKFNVEVIDTDKQFEFLMRQCIREAVTGKPRPVHLDVIGRDAIETDYADVESPCLGGERLFGHYPPFRPSADAEMVKKAADAIATAKKPVIIAGRGAAVSGAGEEILALAKKNDIPVMTTPDGKTLIDERDDYWAGVIGNYGMNCANRLTEQADLVIYIGTQVSDQVTLDWTCPVPGVKVIQIDIAPEELGRCYPGTIGLCGDAKTVVSQLLAAVDDHNRSEWIAVAQRLLAETDQKQAETYQLDGQQIHPAGLCKAVEKALPDDGILVVDTGYTTIWASTIIRMKSTQNFYRATGSLGWSFPGSIGVKCGAPERPVVCLSGDGGFFYHLSEMETQMRYGINSVTVIDNNQTLSACIPQSEMVYADDVERGVNKIRFSKFSYANIAKEFGLYAVRVEREEDIAPAIEAALNSGRPALVEVMTAAVKHLPSKW